MPRVITFSEYFPKYHPLAGAATFFPEKIEDSTKVHTIRKGNRWKAGDLFSPRIWSGRPYASKQIPIREPLAVVSVQSIQFSRNNDYGFCIHIDGHFRANSHQKWATNFGLIQQLASNDGLRLEDFIGWFPQDFTGQIIHWTDLSY